MANLAAIRAVGSSLADYLNNAYRVAPFPTGVTKPGCTFSTVGSTQIQTQPDPTTQSVQALIFLYRVAIDPHLRNAGRAATPDMQPVPLSVDLHYLISFWSLGADNELLALAWTMRQLHTTPLLDGTILSRDAEWGMDETVHVIPAELSNEDMMRLWDALRPDYRLSVAYIARVVRIDPDVVEPGRPVVATRFNLAVPAAAP